MTTRRPSSLIQLRSLQDSFPPQGSSDVVHLFGASPRTFSPCIGLEQKALPPLRAQNQDRKQAERIGAKAWYLVTLEPDLDNELGLQRIGDLISGPNMSGTIQPGGS